MKVSYEHVCLYLHGIFPFAHHAAMGDTKKPPRSHKAFESDDLRILTASEECFVTMRLEDQMLGTLIPGHEYVNWTNVEYGGNTLCSCTDHLFAQDASREGRFVIDVICLKKGQVLFSVPGEKRMLCLKLLPSHVLFYGTTEGQVASCGPSGIVMNHSLPNKEQPVSIEPCPKETTTVLVLTQSSIYCVDTLKGILTALNMPVSTRASLAQW